MIFGNDDEKNNIGLIFIGRVLIERRLLFAFQSLRKKYFVLVLLRVLASSIMSSCTLEELLLMLNKHRGLEDREGLEALQIDLWTLQEESLF